MPQRVTLPAWWPTRDEVLRQLVIAAAIGAAACLVHRLVHR